MRKSASSKSSKASLEDLNEEIKFSAEVPSKLDGQPSKKRKRDEIATEMEVEMVSKRLKTNKEEQ